MASHYLRKRVDSAIEGSDLTNAYSQGDLAPPPLDEETCYYLYEGDIYSLPTTTDSMHDTNEELRGER